MIKKEIGVGFLVGIIANLIGIYLYITFFSDEGFVETLKLAKENDFLGKIVSLGAVLNLGVFFVFIKKKRDYRARGVLLATVFIAIGTFLTKIW